MRRDSAQHSAQPTAYKTNLHQRMLTFLMILLLVNMYVGAPNNQCPTYGHVEVGVATGPVGDPGEGVGHQHILDKVRVN